MVILKNVLKIEKMIAFFLIKTWSHSVNSPEQIPDLAEFFEVTKT